MSATVLLSGDSFHSIDRYIVQKLRLTAALYEINLKIEFESEPSKESGSTILLKVDGDTGISSPSPVHSQQNAILRYIVSLSSKQVLSDSDSSLHQAQIDQWLEASWRDLEIPLQTYFSLLSDSQLSEEEKKLVRAKVHSDAEKYLVSLDEHLSLRTYIVGERTSLADVALYASFVAATSSISDLAKFPLKNLARWAGTIENHPALAPILGSAKLHETSHSIGKWDRGRIRVKELLAKGVELIGQEVVLKGWIRTMRSADKGQVLFVELTDGSTVKGLQLVLNVSTSIGAKDVSESGGAGASISVLGLVVASPAKGQAIEVNVMKAVVLGPVYGGENGEIGGKNYPMAKKQHTLEFLREKAHLRPRSKVFSSAIRMRHAMAFATHKFFNERGFIYVHTPLITAADCEGAGEQFTVTSLLPEHAKLTSIPVDKQGNVDFSKDFFGRRCCLTVSGQLNVETHACALSDVYTFGPTFRAENSHTARHLAEFWMIEPEICFAELADDMALAEDYVRYCAAYALEHCADDIHYFEHEYPQGEKGLQARLQNVVDSDFARITYTEAVALLQNEIKEKRVKFEKYPNWGDDLGSEHERYITEKIYKKPTIVINYPKGIKAFYMKLNDDNETVAAMDILVPKIGELIGGSQREDNLAILEQRCVASGIKPQDIWWYADLRRYGTVPHAGFGLGFERLIMFVTGLENIRDVIPFPRVPGHAEF